MKRTSENILNYISTTTDKDLIRKHATSSNILVQFHSLFDNGLHVTKVINYSLCDTTNKFTISHTYAYTNDRFKKYHKFVDGKVLKCTYISNSNFYKWLRDNKAIILTTTKLYMNTLDSEVVELVKIIKKNRLRRNNLQSICNLYNKISNTPDKYTTKQLAKSSTIVNNQNYLEIAYTLLAKEKKCKNLTILLYKKNAIMKVNCQSSIVITNHCSILDGIQKVQDLTCMDIFLQKINAHI